MTHTYKVTGMTCGGCEAKVKSTLLALSHVSAVEVSKENQSATITMDKHIPLSIFQNHLDKKYSITALNHNETTEETKSWWATYKPILIIFAYIVIIAAMAGMQRGVFDWMQAMNIFMAGFFLTFSFFKMLDLQGFADSYAMYDIIAKKFKTWGYMYAFIEMFLGLAYATNFWPVTTNLVTLGVMTLSLIGVLQSVFNKRKIRCACLGAVFNLPMSAVTIIENALMIVMSGIMLMSLI
ncbi:MAG: heavy-metal-associated domain-containing protein [Chitinophagaceae bacterium]|nr:MAG: heavy-metal-associated domain-containing protein [Chitinophagaceae bacterium]